MFASVAIVVKIASLSFMKLLALAVVISLVGCTTGYAPVSDLNYQSSKPRPPRLSPQRKKRINTTAVGTYKVKPGDTLYSIAWRYGLDFKRLAKNNNIGANYTIYKDQVLAITPSKSSRKTLKNRDHSINKTDSSSSNADENRDSRGSGDDKKSPKSMKSSQNTPSNTKHSKSPRSSKQRHLGMRWVWPAKGRLINKFSRENKGLNISGKSGDSVFAAASGKVVYAGNGIIGYGNLIIIKHSQQYLSAYAHNSVILIKENTTIKAGGKIAEIGSSGTIKTFLHFEIRKDGKPVDPLKYLPK